MMSQRVGGVAVTALGIGVMTDGDVWGAVPLGLLFVVVGTVTLADVLVGGRTAVSFRTAVGIVAAWLVLVVGLRARTLAATRPEVGVLDPNFWEVVLLDPWLTAPLVGALVLPFTLGGRLARVIIGLVVVGLFALTLALYAGGGFGIRFNVLLYSVTFAVGVAAGLLAYAPVLLFGSDGTASSPAD